jgi:hypothetical protein
MRKPGNKETMNMVYKEIIPLFLASLEIVQLVIDENKIRVIRG